MNNRRRFIAILPWATLAGGSMLAACSDKAPAPTATPSPAPAPAPEPAPTPVTAAPPPVAAAPAAGGSMVSPSETQAAALGYVEKSSEADKAKFATHDPSQVCAGCALYSGAAGADAGPCSIFAGRQVSAQGWCSAWAKKA